ncbi:Zinc finger MYM-type protein 6-like 1 [Homarus americanus]|uniref:Zinc finger MYM-type protein 6-like 1 n=1 Tax=Homarus americanus TaxID=6706 RepID=A0A8J5TVY5_HOMAM|nr:Zinc finger MYM-type protein 6-like 1 [Homarus americanus]
MSMQGRDETYLTLSEKLKEFKAKLRLWKGKIERGKAASFPLLNPFLEDEDVSLLDVQNIIVEHLEKLSDEFDRYIPNEELHEKYKWVRTAQTLRCPSRRPLRRSLPFEVSKRSSSKAPTFCSTCYRTPRLVFLLLESLTLPP